MTTHDASDRPNTAALMALPLEELARLWLAAARLGMQRGGDDSAFMDELNGAIGGGDPRRVLDLIREVLRVETDPDMLTYLAATLLENMLPREEDALLDAVVAAIGEDVRFADLFFDILFNGLEGPVEDRIVAAVTAAVGGRAAPENPGER